MFWGEALWAKVAAARPAAGMQHLGLHGRPRHAGQKLAALAEAVDRLTRDFGNWRMPWGEINRFQRNDDAIVQTFRRRQAQIPVPFTSSQWGSLAAFGARRYPARSDTTAQRQQLRGRRWSSGPGCARVAVTAGGESGDPASPHFNDQASAMRRGTCAKVYFYPEELKGHIERVYHPGE